MIKDKNLEFSTAQALTASARSTNVIDLGVARNLFDGEPLCAVVNVDVAADSVDAGTFAFKLETDDNSDFTSATELVSKTILQAALAVNTNHIIPIPVGVEVERYLALYATLGGDTPTVTITAFLIPLSMVDKYKAYNDNVTIN
jgi:hypothetical protein